MKRHLDGQRAGELGAAHHGQDAGADCDQGQRRLVDGALHRTWKAERGVGGQKAKWYQGLARPPPVPCVDAGKPQRRGRAGIENKDVSSVALEELLRSANSIIPITPCLAGFLTFVLFHSLRYIRLGDYIFPEEEENLLRALYRPSPWEPPPPEPFTAPARLPWQSCRHFSSALVYLANLVKSKKKKKSSHIQGLPGPWHHLLSLNARRNLHL